MTEDEQLTAADPTRDQGAVGSRRFTLATAEDTRAFGRYLGSQLRAGDVVLLHGGLGAGKTTLTQGLAAGLGVQGRVTSPTFVIARVHEPLAAGPTLVHVDAYRIEDGLDLETLDLDSSLADSVTVIEWGAGKVEVLSAERLEVSLQAVEVLGADWSTVGDDPRLVELSAIGERWQPRVREWDLGRWAGPQHDLRSEPDRRYLESGH